MGSERMRWKRVTRALLSLLLVRSTRRLLPLPKRFCIGLGNSHWSRGRVIDSLVFHE